MSSYYATAPVVFSNHPLATTIPHLVYNPFGIEGKLSGSGPRWTDSIWMLHGKTKLDVICILAEVGDVVWSNVDYTYPIVSDVAVHLKNYNEEGVQIDTINSKDLSFSNDRTKSWITDEYNLATTPPDEEWDYILGIDEAVAIIFAFS